jgi:hypothetical protein
VLPLFLYTTIGRAILLAVFLGAIALGAMIAKVTF